MGLFSNLFRKNKSTSELVENNSSLQIEDEDEVTAVIAAVLASMDEEETVAAITAAIACMLGTSTSNFVVRNIKRTPCLDSIWAHTGRMKLMR
ncbi:sodium pump decarboxylase subunit gamma [Sedimentibacter sp. MB31-C6]|uniref:sodium pump decarboxylase subunit gamma n=1 Tax=Sedimentibacter sp. MB31-C6 TaxID=3109366 RepID=UPI002DDDB9FD|nr:sodium pump decarboxylase subunit gamma [Sedimentibacter sp. MB36-C1]WSI03788.1 sodium pump decarboxylase subunit gamma [Sedimentibacter sp. MB36-C1]